MEPESLPKLLRKLVSGWSGSSVSRLVGRDPSLVRRWLSGAGRPNAADLDKLLDACGASEQLRLRVHAAWHECTVPDFLRRIGLSALAVHS